MRIRLILLLLLFLTGCSVKQSPIGKKVIPNEDEYIIKALMYEDENNLTATLNLYKFLYDKTKKPVYFEKMIENLFYQKEYKDVLKLSN